MHLLFEAVLGVLGAVLEAVFDSACEELLKWCALTLANGYQAVATWISAVIR